MSGEQLLAYIYKTSVSFPQLRKNLLLQPTVVFQRPVLFSSIKPKCNVTQSNFPF